jgi:glutamate N-acetyltransferase/amino-acid N-acetyltransferase
MVAIVQPHPIVVAPETSRFFGLPDGARLEEPPDGSPGVTYPRGFLAGGTAVGLKNSGRPDMGVLCVEPEWHDRTVSAAVYTTNAFAAAPITVTREECETGRLVALVINSGNANACTGPYGLTVARAMQTSCAEALGVPVAQVGVASTGIIGEQLDAAFMAEAATKAAAVISSTGGDGFSHALKTTDRFGKVSAVELDLSGGTVRLGVCAKGAGMIAPAMATMICVVTTDAVLSAEQAEDILSFGSAGSFNLISVDGEMSTNDVVFLLADGASGVTVSGADLALMKETMRAMLLRIALMMVADGEGATKVIKVTVRGAATDDEAAYVCRAIADSQLVKTAMHGGDPNWGRIISSVGAALPGRSLPDVALYMCGVQVVENGTARAVPAAEWAQLKAGMQAPEVEIDLDLGVGTGAAELYFADMGHEYITINAEYHS